METAIEHSLNTLDAVSAFAAGAPVGFVLVVGFVAFIGASWAEIARQARGHEDLGRIGQQ